MLVELKDLSTDQIKTIIGVCLIKLSTGVIGCWGSINLYILSYFYHQGASISPSTNSIILVLNIVPMALVILIATKLSDKFGYQMMIKICALIFFLSPMMIFYSFTVQIVLIFCLFLPMSAFGISSVSVINCVWTQFPKSKNKATSIAVIFFGLGGVLWNYLFTLYVNPNNESASIKDEYSKMSLFSENVSGKVPQCMKTGCVICGLLFMVGAWLVKKNIRYEDSSIISEEQLGAMSYDPLLQKQTIIEATKKIKKSKSLKQALLDSRFILIFVVSFLSGNYQIFLNTNIKIIYISIINDDRFLVYCAMTGAAISICGAFFWGYIGDKKGFFVTLFAFAVLDCLFKMYGDFATTKISIFILFILVGLTDKAMLTIMGPGLVKMFGIQIGTELLPYKGVSVLLGYILAPLVYICLSSYITPFEYLQVLSVCTIPSVYYSYKLYQKKGAKTS